MTEINTIKTLLQASQQRLHDLSDSAKLDCQLLLAKALDKPTSYLLTWPEKTLTETQVEYFDCLFIRRLNGEPIAYILQEKEFWSLTLKVAPSTLIPRPDTETLVELVLNNHTENELSCLDLGTGTGAIALALASEKNQWQVDAIDFNVDAVELAKENAKTHQLTHVNIYQSDWFHSVDKSKKFNVIVSNPPYIDEQDHHLIEGDVRFEPLSALVAKQKGLADINHIAEQALPYFVAEGGAIYFEHGFEQAEQVQNILVNLGYQKVLTVKDLSGNNRITYGCYLP